MEILNLETRYQGEIKLPKILIDGLPNKIMIATTVQFLGFLPQIQSQLKSKEIHLFKSKHGFHPGQILGCDTFKVQKDIEAFLYIGDGLFHPTALLINQKPVYTYNPFSEKYSKLSAKEINQYRIKKKVQLSQFYAADKIGIIVSSKPGQNALSKALEFRDRIKHQKETFLFITNYVSLPELENFPFIDTWVNTACPRIDLLHMDEIE